MRIKKKIFGKVNLRLNSGVWTSSRNILEKPWCTQRRPLQRLSEAQPITRKKKNQHTNHSRQIIISSRNTWTHRESLDITSGLIILNPRSHYGSFIEGLRKIFHQFSALQLPLPSTTTTAKVCLRRC